MDDERLKNPPGKGHKDYFDELLERIRDIRSSERRFYQKVLDIYATSVDYTLKPKCPRNSCKGPKQNALGHARPNCSRSDHQRADAEQPQMGLKSTRPGGVIHKDDVSIAKNYLDEEELQTLNRIVNAYLEFAELQALSRRPMTMADWILKLDEFLKLTGRELLHHAGKISADDARAKAEAEYERYRRLLDSQPRRIDDDLDQAAKEIKKLPNRKKPRKPRDGGNSS